MATDPHDAIPMIGEAPAFVAMLEHVSQAAPLNRPVLVMGERGTGKELVAERLHFLSARWDKPLVKINCAALTESLLDTELFGHEAGAFTGATRTHVGHFESAADGTLILDELGTISQRMQEKILRVIEYREFRRVGGSATLTTDARVIGVTNEDLPALAQRGEFRADLLDRLAFDVIHVPPLRARPEDILSLAFHFGVNIASELKRSYFAGFAPSARAMLLGHGWPGNVRELKNAVERSVYRTPDPDAALEAILFDPFATPVADENMGEATAAAAEPVQRFPLDFKATVTELEQKLLGEALLRAQHNQRQTAELLGLSYHQLRGLIRKYGAALDKH
ncbi:MAG: phage shock protein operon transcriptional activator [Gammaproteobacteria bacterium]|nr:phage shock protein operon transcriptional activator [Gammaproteobacteria bacterium]MDH3505530.1 phage shock protein operon transcriptional activator [Gammaproteobacteria bacterium]